MKPTQKQIDFATRLGIDIPEGISRSGLSRLIDHALLSEHRGEQCLDHLPNDVARNVMANKGEFVSHQRLTAAARAGKYLREREIRVGSIVFLDIGIENYRGFYTVIRFVADMAQLRKIGRQRTFSVRLSRRRDGHDPLSLRHNPVSGFFHEVFLFPRKEHLKKRDFVASHIAPCDQYSNEFGLFWRKTAVDALIQEYGTASRRQYGGSRGDRAKKY